MDYIERPKKVNKSEQSVQDNKYLQKNMQSQFNNIYDYLDKISDNIDDTSISQTIEDVREEVSALQENIESIEIPFAFKKLTYSDL